MAKTTTREEPTATAVVAALTALVLCGLFWVLVIKLALLLI